ncbi:GntR family transcriptional regulator [Streptomyces antioxidans]|uniref:GntR family transcriptional regulator n=1 Tax=Streptomyces antioxidans TaxID=1507734 RepID=A0A1V4DBI2_9ACTN|nr:GntR family transcriptional regulator [Streptomyces antioxidans]OPF83722.1 GntR family transcriptional regulator [Streptomyces antioxidans]
MPPSRERAELTLKPLPHAKQSLAEQVISEVRRAVHTGAMVPGQLYSVYQVAEKLNVSRSPVREALLRLEEAGLVQVERNRGFRVVLPHPREIIEIFGVRLALELPAVRRVARAGEAELGESLRATMEDMAAAVDADDELLFFQLDQTLHDHILIAAGNSRARAIVGGLRDTMRILGMSTDDQSRSLRRVHEEHEPIVAALLAADAEGAVRAMRDHLSNTGLILAGQAARAQGEPVDTGALWASIVDESDLT